MIHFPHQAMLENRRAVSLAAMVSRTILLLAIPYGLWSKITRAGRM